VVVQRGIGVPDAVWRYADNKQHRFLTLTFIFLQYQTLHVHDHCLVSYNIDLATKLRWNSAVSQIYRYKGAQPEKKMGLTLLFYIPFPSTRPYPLSCPSITSYSPQLESVEAL